MIIVYSECMTSVSTTINISSLPCQFFPRCDSDKDADTAGDYGNIEVDIPTEGPLYSLFVAAMSRV